MREITLDDDGGAKAPTSGSVQIPKADVLVAAPAVAPVAVAAAPLPLGSQTDLDIAALERAAQGYTEQTAADMLVDKHATVPGSLPAPIPLASELSPSAPKPIAKPFSKPNAAPVASAAPVQAPPAKSSKYGTTQQAMKRPPSARPRESLFGQDLLSEKSLDEVIMSYLSDDLDKE